MSMRLFTHIEVKEVIDEFMKFHLDLAQASLSKHQFKAFRKMVLDRHANLLKSIGKDRDGKMSNKGKGGGEL